MANPPNNFNTNTSFNKYKGSYFNNDVDISGGNIINRTGNLYLAPNSNIYTSNNQIQFDDVYKFTNFIYNVNIYGQQKLTYNSVVYDVGEKLEKIASLETKLTNITYTTGTDTTTISDNIIFTGNLNNISSVTYSYLANVTGDIAFSITNLQTQIDGINSISLSSNNTFTGSNIFSETLRLNNNLRLQGTLIVDNGGTTITNATLRNLQYLSNVTSDINTSISNLNTKLTNISYAGVTTSFGGTLSFPNNSINSAAISNSTFVALTGAQSAGGQKTWTGLNIFSSNIRLDTGSLILNTNTLTLTNATLQKIQFLSTVSSDIQTQINNITGVSLSAINVFSGAFNTFSNNIRLDGSLLLNAGTSTITNATLQKLQYLSNITSDIKASLDTLTDKMSGFYRSETTGTYFFESNLNTLGKFNTLTGGEIGYLTGMTENLQLAITNLKTKTDTTNVNLATTTVNANDVLQRTQEISFSNDPTPQTTITNKLVTEELVFTTDLNDITPTTFGYLANCSSNIQTQLDSKLTAIPGTIIQHISANLQTNFPTRFLLCNGQSVSRTTYANLFSWIGTTYGSVDGNSFNIPDFTACFLRMAGSARTVNGVTYTPNAVGTIQQDSLEAHVHSSNLTGTYLNSSTTSGTHFPGGMSRYNTTSFPEFTGGVSSSHRTSTETKPLNHSVYFYIYC